MHDESGEELSPVSDSITIRQRHTIGSQLFDTVGRVRMISATYIISGVLLGVAGFFLHSFTAVTLTAVGMVIFFFASAGASGAYLTAEDVAAPGPGRTQVPA